MRPCPRCGAARAEDDRPADAPAGVGVGARDWRRDRARDWRRDRARAGARAGSACPPCGHRSRRGRVTLGAFAALLALGLLAAWLLPMLQPEPRPLTQAEAEALAREGLDALLADLADPAGGAVRVLTAELHLADARPYLAGPVDVTLELEWGRDGTARSLLLAQAGTLPIRIEHWCAPDRLVVDRQGQVSERRPEGLAPCTAPLRDEAATGNLTLVSARPDGRGAQALYEDAEGNLFNASVDAKGRVLRFGVAGARGDGAVHVGYGERAVLAFPTPRTRDPARLEARAAWDNGTYEWLAYGGDEAPLDEFEVRVVDGGRVLARFDPTGPTEQSQNGVVFRFRDDGDRSMGPGDAFVLETGLRTDGMEVVVWDRWAGAAAGSAAVPTPLPLALLAVAGAALSCGRLRPGRSSR